MRRLLLLSLLGLTACASNPYGTGKNQGYFLGAATISSNIGNLCQDTNMKYAFMSQQYWLAGGSALTWYGCTPDHQVNLSPEYMIHYSIIKNDGSGKNVVAQCIPSYKGNASDQHFKTMNLIVQLNKDVPSCQAILS
ncbi:MAG: hypothetical protein NTV32_03995 [Gammaproteobacteria bacterium]|nr:hypothetical protein [Gammaproteobacteria bacterium]